MVIFSARSRGRRLRMEVLCRRSLSGLKEASAGSGRGSKRLRESDDVTTGASEHGAAWSGRVAKRFRVTDEVGTGASDHDVTLKKA